MRIKYLLKTEILRSIPKKSNLAGQRYSPLIILSIAIFIYNILLGSDIFQSH